jgi:hypothetical protein
LETTGEAEEVNNGCRPDAWCFVTNGIITISLLLAINDTY